MRSGELSFLLRAHPHPQRSVDDLAVSAEALDDPQIEILGRGEVLRLIVPESRLTAALSALATDRVEVLALGARNQAEVDVEASHHGRYEVTGAHLDLALDIGGLGVWEWDIPRDVVAWSSHLELIHGFDAGSFPGTFEAFAATIHPDDREAVLGGVRAALESSSDLVNEYRFVRVDGSTGWLRGRARLLRDERGQPMAFVGVAIDETEQAAQRALLEEQKAALEAATAERATLVEMLQKTLLPYELTSPDGMIVEAAFRAAGVEATGDFIDLYRWGVEEGWLLVVGDIAGHGPEAAILSGSVRRSIHSASTLATDPATLLRTANRVHLDITVDHRFATLHIASLRRNSDDTVGVVVGTAGHPPLLVVRASGDIDWLAGTGPPIGVAADVAYVQAEAVLASGDSLVAYSDGITEAGVRSVGAFGEERLARHVLAHLKESGPEGVATSLLSAAVDHAQGAVTDDAACVVVTVI